MLALLCLVLTAPHGAETRHTAGPTLALDHLLGHLVRAQLLEGAGGFEGDTVPAEYQADLVVLFYCTGDLRGWKVS